MPSSLSNLVNNLTEEIHKIKLNDKHNNKKRDYRDLYVQRDALLLANVF